MRRVLTLLLCLSFVACAPRGNSEVTVAHPAERPASSRPEVAALMRAMPEEDEFAPRDIDKAKNLPIFVELAATSQDEALRVAALRAMRDAYPAHAVDSYTRAVARNLTTNQPGILQAALEASSPSLGAESSPEVRQAVRKLTASPSRAVRLAALDTYWQAEPFPASTYLEALADPDTVIRAMALQHIVQQKVRRHEFFQPAFRLMGDADPGLRGKSIDLAIATANPQERVMLTGRLVTMLRDIHPYVRSQAALGLAQLGAWTAASRLTPLLNDSSTNTYELNYTNLVDEPERIYFKASRWPRVDDAALTALSRLNGFRYHEARDEAELQEQIQRARLWNRRD